MERRVKDNKKEREVPDIDLNESLSKFDVKELLGKWREIKDMLDYIEAELKPYKKRLTQIQDEISNHLSITEGDEKRETISVPNLGYVYKKKHVGAKVTDFDSFQRFCTRHNVEFVLRKQTNLAGLTEMYKMIMEGDLPEPKSADFYTFEKITIRKR